MAVRIPAPPAVLQGDLVVPSGARGVVLFAHGSGSSRRSPRNRFVARTLQDVGFATLLFDLLTSREEADDVHTGAYRFDVDLLADRLMQATQWVIRHESVSGLPVGYFGASTGGGAALVAAARLGRAAAAVVSRGGRPDLAGASLPRVLSPTLLIVGGEDRVVLGMNEEAYRELRSEKSLRTVPGATHLFEEPGALEEVARLAADWFGRHLVRETAERGDAEHDV